MNKEPGQMLFEIINPELKWDAFLAPHWKKWESDARKALCPPPQPVDGKRLWEIMKKAIPEYDFGTWEKCSLWFRTVCNEAISSLVADILAQKEVKGPWEVKYDNAVDLDDAQFEEWWNVICDKLSTTYRATSHLDAQWLCNLLNGHFTEPDQSQCTPEGDIALEVLESIMDALDGAGVAKYTTYEDDASQDYELSVIARVKLLIEQKASAPIQTECTGERLREAVNCLGLSRVAWSQVTPERQAIYQREEAKLRAEFAVDSNPWVRASDRMPTEEDADEHGNVEWWGDGWTKTCNSQVDPWDATLDDPKPWSWRRIVRPAKPEQKDAFEEWFKTQGEWCRDKEGYRKAYLAGQQSKEESK